MKTRFAFLLLLIIIFSIAGCLPCHEKKLKIFPKNLTIVYPDYDCNSRDSCSKLNVYKLSEDLTGIVDTICVPNKNKDIFPTNCYVSFSVTVFRNPLLIVIEGTYQKDTIYDIIIEDPCQEGQPFLNDKREGGKILTNINGKWYETEVIFR